MLHDVVMLSKLIDWELGLYTYTTSSLPQSSSEKKHVYTCMMADDDKKKGKNSFLFRCETFKVQLSCNVPIRKYKKKVVGYVHT